MALDFLGDTSKYFSNYTPSDLASNTFSGVNYDYSLPTSDTSGLWGDSLMGGGKGLGSEFSLGSLPWGNIIGTLGKLGAGIGGFISARGVNSMPDYIPTTQWLGNGLARTGFINNTQNKQNKLDQAAGATNALGQTFELFRNRYNDKYNDGLNNNDFGEWLNQQQKKYSSVSPDYSSWQV